MNMLKRIPERFFEWVGSIVGFSASFFVLLQIRQEWQSRQPSSLSLGYLLGFLMIYAFWTLYGLRFQHLAIWMTNGLGTLLQGVLIVIVMGKTF